MSFDEALDTILEIERIWIERRGHVTLADLGFRHPGRPMPGVPQAWTAYAERMAERGRAGRVPPDA